MDIILNSLLVTLGFALIIYLVIDGIVEHKRKKYIEAQTQETADILRKYEKETSLFYRKKKSK